MGKMRNKEQISNKQGISLIILFLIGEASIFIQGVNAKNDLWLAYLLGVFLAIPLIFIFARLQSLFPDKNLFDVIEIIFGKYLSKILILIFVWYVFYEAVMTTEVFTFFIRTVVFPETPSLVIAIMFFSICSYIVKNGIEVLARFGELFIIIPVLLIITIFVLLLPDMKLSNVTPILYEGINPVYKGAFLFMEFPLAYIVSFTFIFKLNKQKNSAYKIYFYGFLIGSIILFIIYVLVLLVLGAYHASVLYFPTYTVVSLINIGNFLQRFDIIAAIIYLIGIYIQASVLLFVTCKGISKLFVFSDYRFVALPVALLILNLASYDCESIMRYFEFCVITWPYYILPYEVILPFIIWIVAEIRVKKIKKSNFRIS